MSSFKLLMPIIVVLWGLAGYTQWYEILPYSNGFGIQDNIEVTEMERFLSCMLILFTVQLILAKHGQ